MADAPSTGSERYARCPACGTVFRVTPAQLARRAGQVRCGRCKTVFDAGVATAAGAPELQRDAAAGGDAVASPPTPIERAPAVHAEAAGDAVAERPAHPPASTTAPARRAKTQAPQVDARTRRRDRVLRLAYGTAIPLLVLLLAAQALFHFSSAIAAHWPAAAPAMARLCESAGCSVHPVPDASMQYLAIDASDLHADPAHKGLLILTATIRNRAAWTLAYPHLELTLTDAQDEVVVRRALAPAEYAGGTVDVARGLRAHGELAVRLFIDASATVQSGYRLYLFYP